MKRLAIFVLMMSLAGLAAAAETAAKKTEIHLNMGGGFSLPVGGWSEDYGAGFQFGAAVNVGLAPNFSLFGDIRLNSFGIKSGAYGYPSDATLTGGTDSLISIFAGAKFWPAMTGKVHAYGLAGIGMGFQSYADLVADYTIRTPGYTAIVHEVTTLGSTSAFGLAVGGGLAIDLSPMIALNGEIRYVLLFGSGGAAYFPITVGLLLRI